MAGIRANRDAVSDRFSVAGFRVQTGADPWYEVVLTTDPSVIEAPERRTRSNFYSSRVEGPLRAERGEAVYLTPPNVLERFAGQPRLYYGLATFPDAARSRGTIVRVPDEQSPWVSLESFTGAGSRRAMQLPRRDDMNGYGAGNGADDALVWAGDEFAAPSAAPIASNGAAGSAPDAGAQPDPDAAYDDGFGPMKEPVMTDNAKHPPAEAQGHGVHARAMNPALGPAVAIAGTVINVISSSSGDVRWTVDKLDGIKHPNDDASKAGSGAWRRKRQQFQGVTWRGVDDIGLGYEIEWDYNGRSLGNVLISPTTPNDAVGFSLHMTANILNDPNTYGGAAALRVRCHYHFTRKFGSDGVAIQDITLYADGTHHITTRWTQASTFGAAPVAGSAFDVRWDDVPLVAVAPPQSCWDAVMAMLAAWKRRAPYNPGAMDEYRSAVQPWNDLNADTFSIKGLAQLLQEQGPLGVGQAETRSHAVAVTGMWGDGSPAGTTVRYHDPRPVATGARDQEQTWAEFAAEHAGPGGVSVGSVQVLTAGGRTAAAQGYTRSYARMQQSGGGLSPVSPEDVERMRQTFTDNVAAGSPKSCIVITNAGLRELYGPRLRTSDGSNRSLGSTIQDTMGKLNGYGLAGSAKVIEFNDSRGRLTRGVVRPHQLRESVEGWMMSAAGAASASAWYVFGLSIMDGYHSVVIALQFSGAGNAATKVFWADQIYSGWDDVTGQLDARITQLTQRWWDPLPQDRKARTRVTLWPLRAAPATAGSQGRQMAAHDESADGIEGYEEESEIITVAQQSADDCSDDFCPARQATSAVSEHFNLEEFRCRDGTAVPERFRGHIQNLMDNLEVLRAELGGVPIRITSGYRTCSYNSTLEGAASRSRHLCGQAADIQVTDHTPLEVRDAIEQLIGAGRMTEGGLGLYNTFVHYDIRGVRARWDRRRAAAAQGERELAHV